MPGTRAIGGDEVISTHPGDQPMIDEEPTDPVEAALWRFAGAANKGNLHQTDDDRFYEFIVVASENKNKWKPEQVRNQLRILGMPEACLDILAERYRVGRCALLKKDRMDSGNGEPVY
jgi:hypothetical protein